MHPPILLQSRGLAEDNFTSPSEVPIALILFLKEMYIILK